VNADGEIKAFGVFTRSLMSALRGEEEDAIEVIPGGATQKAVTTQRLAKFLQDAVPLESGKIPGATVQFPDITAVWLDPDRIYSPGPFPETPLIIARSSDEVIKRFDHVSPKFALLEGAQKRVDHANLKANERLERFEQAFNAVIGRRSFETRSGLTIAGDEPVEVIVSPIGPISGNDIFMENDAFHIRGPNDNIPRSIIFRLKSGNWIATALLPNFIGAILIKDGAAASLSYMPSEQTAFSRELQFGQPYAEVISRWTALMYQGTFATSAELNANAGDLRLYKHINPSLGIMAAYAYERAGALEEIDSIAGYFALENQPVPFDVALLSTKLIVKDANGNFGIDVALPNGTSAFSTVAGSFPLLSRGWALLDQVEGAISPKLLELRPQLVRSLWTTLTPKGGVGFAQILQQ
jgi:hypothetical protein